MHITLLIADLLPPPGFALPVAMPVLDAVLARSRVAVSPGSTLEDAVLDAFGCDATAPIAALTAAADFHGQAESVSGKTWLRADPVHFAVSRDNIQLFDSHVIKPTAEEMAAIADTINVHFAEDGLRVVFPDAARGYIEINANDVPTTTPIWAMGNASVFENLPRLSSKSRTNWRARTNEIQMLLHDHPVNQAREAAGMVPINGLWLWGGGGLSGLTITPHFEQVVARLALARGLAVTSGCELQTLPATANALFDAMGNPQGDESSLVVIHTATREIRAQSRETWPDEVARIDRDWIAPAVAALAAGKLASLTMVLPSESATMTIRVRNNGVMPRIKQLFATKRTLKDYA